MVRPVRRALRPSRSRLPSHAGGGEIGRGAGSSTGGSVIGAGSGAVSGASRFMLASAGGGGAPSVLRRFSFERSAILLHLVDQSLNEGVGFGVEAGIAGLGDRPADVHGLTVGGSLQKTAFEGRVAGLVDVALASASSASVPIRLSAKVSLVFGIPACTNA